MEFYFDFLSPYSYLGFEWLKKNKFLLEVKKIEIDFKPVILSQVINHYGGLGPAEITPKRNYLYKDCLRYSAEHGISFTTPELLPFNSLYALRLVLAAEKDKRFKLIEAIFSAGWAFGKNLEDENVLLGLLENLGLDKSLFDKTCDKNIRKELKSNVKQALDKGIFGLPSFVYKNEMFWGNDSTKYLEKFIIGKDPLDVTKYNIFLNKHKF